MSEENWQIRSYIPRDSALIFGGAGFVRFCHSGGNAQLLLHQEPGSPAATAVRVSDLGGGPCGYVAPEHAGEVRARMNSGELIMARMDGGCKCSHRDIIIWSEGSEPAEGEDAGSKIKKDQKKVDLHELFKIKQPEKA